MSDNFLEVWDGTARGRSNAAEDQPTSSGKQLPSCRQRRLGARHVLRPKSTRHADIAVRPGRSLVFEERHSLLTPTVPSSGDTTCQLKLHSGIVRTQPAPTNYLTETTELTVEKATQGILTDASTIDCGTYPDI